MGGQTYDSSQPTPRPADWEPPEPDTDVTWIKSLFGGRVVYSHVANPTRTTTS